MEINNNNNIHINTIEDVLKFYENEKDINWYELCWEYKLSEYFIEKHFDKFTECHLNIICEYQKLSEQFIDKYFDNFTNSQIKLICIYQKLPINFIDKYFDRFAKWQINKICIYQKLSINFIDKYFNIFTENQLDCICKHQKLPVNFIEKYFDKFTNSQIYNISRHQYLSPDFIEKHKNDLYINSIKDNWMYKSTEYKKQQLINTGLYECHDDYFIAYKGIRSDRYSAYNFQYQYLKGQTYETFADYSNNEYSFGFSVWTEDGAREYCDELVVRCKVYYKDIARIVWNDSKVRCCKLEILD